MPEQSADTKRRISVCAGKACAGDDSKKVRKKLKKLVKKRGLKDRIQIKKCSCLGDCGKGPVLAIEPGGERVNRVTPKRAKKLLAKLTAGETPREVN